MTRLGQGIVLIIALSGAFTGPLGAESGISGQEGGDFTFRRVAPPEGTPTKRITVQIDPDEEVYRITPGSDPRRPGDPRPEAATQLPAGLVPQAPSGYEWYWEAVPPALGVDQAERFFLAMDTLQKNAVKVGTPRLATLQGIVDRHGIDILTATVGTEVSPALVLAVISVESAGQVDAVSHAGAEGLMQLMPATATRFGVNDSKDARQNIKGGVTYLDWLLDEFGGDAVLALAGYNAGEGAVGKHQGVPPFAETRDYVAKVAGAYAAARTLCASPPRSARGACKLK